MSANTNMEHDTKFKKMPFFGEKCKKWTVFSLAIGAVTLGLVLVLIWNSTFKAILYSELSVSNNASTGYTMWKETPIPMYIHFYMYNWSNSEEVIKDWSVKPAFVEMGPYTFTEHHIRVNTTWNGNGTLSFQQKRIWHFVPEMSNGSLSDEVVNLNVIAATIAYVVRHSHYLIRRAVSVLLTEKESSIAVRKTVGELIFDGYEDEILKLSKDLNITALNIPFDKFGWFYQRNGSSEYDGNFTMYDGSDDIRTMGYLQLWNRKTETEFYPGKCGKVRGTCGGELWPADQQDLDEAVIFTPDLCSTLTLKKLGKTELDGVEGFKYVGDHTAFDNGTYDPDTSCYNVGEGVPSGSRNVSLCRFHAPAFISFPHFYLSDQSYRDKIVGMHPDPEKHEFYLSLEPETGVPLEVHGRVQINIMVQPIEGIWLFEKAHRIFFPMLWFEQTAVLTPHYTSLVKTLLTLPSVGNYTGYGILGIGILILISWTYICVYKGWKGRDSTILLSSQQSLS